MRRWLQWIFGTIGALLVLIVLAVVWVLNSHTGTRSALRMAERVLHEQLAIETIQGSFAGPLVLSSLRYTDPTTGFAVAAQRIELDVVLLELIRGRLHIAHLTLQDIDVDLGRRSETPQEPQARGPFTLRAPVDIIVDAFALDGADLHRMDEKIVRLDSVKFGGRWIDTEVRIEELEVRSPDGELQFAGRMQEAGTYSGKGAGRFRWRAADTVFTGTLEIDAPAQTATVNVALDRPLRADLKVILEQTQALPWQFELTVPSFDPRATLLPDSSWQSVSLALEGRGTRERGVVEGDLVLNGEPLRFDRLTLERNNEQIDLMLNAALGGGKLDASSTIRLDVEPLSVRVDARWEGINVPERWFNRALFTAGTIVLSGSAQSYRAQGQLELGPPQRIAAIELTIEGSASSVGIHQLDIVQPNGRFAASGKLDLEPRLSWSLAAQATRFNPGDFVPDWPGALSFDLKTAGVLDEAGPTANVHLTRLRGRLRDRAIAGEADITLAANRNLSGHIDLRSGTSRFQLHAKPGEAVDAVARINVPALDDWIPNAKGSLRGTFSALGRWPNVSVDGQARATALHVGELRAEALQLNIDVSNPTEPEGFVELRLRNAVVAGMQIDTLRANASGDAAEHAVELTMSGSPLGARLSLTGALVENDWRGRIDQLVLDIEEVAHLTLQQPVDVAHSRDGTRVSQACFTDGDIRLCFDAAVQGDGAMQARYALANVPLALANVAMGDSDLRFLGTLRGDGDFRRSADGVLAGNARLESDSAEIARQASESDAADVLLSIADLRAVASLDGDRAQARIDARLNDAGSLAGRVEVAGLGQDAASLEGSVNVALPSITVVELFVPQLANVDGALDVRLGLRGTLDQPELRGTVRLLDLAADVPELGLQLKNGGVLVTARPNQTFDIDGRLESGPGHIALAGIAALEGSSSISIKGERFLAANLPGARVIVEPDLSIEHVPARVTVNGTLRIPEANINLQQLPGGQGAGARASADVVVIDDEAASQEEQAAALPVHAEVTVIVGENVELVGFGLLANVAGQLTVRERPGEPTTGSGEIRVSGTYKAYGQDLTIQQGSLLYANTPLENPNLRLVATRRVDNVTAGLRVSGNAANPVLAVFSEPEMGQANALSYLVTGKPIDQIGQSEGEGDALQAAARSLGTAAGGLVAKNLGRRLGVDEIGIKNSEVVGGSVFTIGQYLSPRLFLSYGVGLFDPGDVITLRYKLTESLAVQAESGSKESRAGIEYRRER